LISAHNEGRKVIILDHEYAGARWKAKQLWDNDYNNRYFDMLRTYKDSVVIEVGGHDHFADLRYHSSYHVADLEDSSTKFYFHNLFVAPGATTYGNSNAGIAYFELTSDYVPTNLRLEFLDLDSTNAVVGTDRPTYEDAVWWSIDYAKQYGVTKLTPDALHDFYTTLKDQDEDKTVDYLVSKLGFNPADS